MYYLIASLAFFLAGLLFFIFSKIRKTGIGYKEFISCNYFFAKVPFGGGIKKKLLLRRLTMADVLEIGNIPNWLFDTITSNEKQTEDKVKEIKEKTKEDLIKETIDYYTYLQCVAEKSIVKFDMYVKKWQEVDPDYLGRLPDETLQYIFNLQYNPSKKVVKKKTSFYVLDLLQKLSKSNRQAT